MDELAFIESQGQKNAAFSLDNFDQLQKRVNGLMVLLLAGAGATGSFALGQWGKGDMIYVMWSLGAVSVWWFAISAWLAMQALYSREVRAPATEGDKLLEYARSPAVARYFEELSSEGQPVPTMVDYLRECEIKTLAKTATIYRECSNCVAVAQDAGFKAAAMTPLIALLAILGVWVAQLIRTTPWPF